MPSLKNKIIVMFLGVFLFVPSCCNIYRPYLRAELIAVVDNYPQDYMKYKDMIDYSREITFCFKIKNTSKHNIFIPINNQINNIYYSFIEVSTANRSTIAPSHLLRNSNTELRMGDSTIMYVHLMDKQLLELDLKRSHNTINKLRKKLKYKYCIDEKDDKLSTGQIPQIEFCCSSNIKYVYRTADKLHVYE